MLESFCLGTVNSYYVGVGLFGDSEFLPCWSHSVWGQWILTMLELVCLGIVNSYHVGVILFGDSEFLPYWSHSVWG